MKKLLILLLMVATLVTFVACDIEIESANPNAQTPETTTETTPSAEEDILNETTPETTIEATPSAEEDILNETTPEAMPEITSTPIPTTAPTDATESPYRTLAPHMPQMTPISATTRPVRTPDPSATKKPSTGDGSTNDKQTSGNSTPAPKTATPKPTTNATESPYRTLAPHMPQMTPISATTRPVRTPDPSATKNPSSVGEANDGSKPAKTPSNFK